MLGISLPEFLIITCIAIILVKPTDLPIIAKYYRMCLNKIASLKKEANTLYHLVQGSILEDKEKDGLVKYVRGNDGKMHEAFDIKEYLVKSKVLKKRTRKSKA